MRRKMAVLWVLLCFVFAVAGCGSGGGSSTGNASGDDLSGDTSERLVVLENVSRQVEEMVNQDSDFDYADVLQVLESNSEIEVIGRGESGSIWARVGSGGPMWVIAIAPTIPAEYIPTSAKTYAAASRLNKAGAFLPDTSSYTTIMALGPAFKSNIPKIADLLEDYGYKSIPSDGSVEALRTVNDIGIFYIKTHGEVLYLSEIGAEQSGVSFALWTASPTTERSQDIGHDVMNDRLLWFTALHKYGFPNIFEQITEEHWAITDKFIDEYMSFAPNSFVLISACRGGHVDADPFRQAFFRKGASVYAGWDEYLDTGRADEAAIYLLDRLLGANQTTPVENPKQRPFDYIALEEDLAKHGLDHSEVKVGEKTYHAYLKFFPNPENSDTAGILSPSIKKMTVEEQNETLTIEGIFGKDYGASRRSVMVGSNKAEIIEWKEDEIKCKLPAGWAGDVLVQVDDRKSNAVQLTEWKTKFKFTRDSLTAKGDTEKAVVNINCNFRADVHDYREQPGQTPIKPTQPITLLPEKNSSATYSYSLQYTFNDDPLWYVTGNGAGTITSVLHVPQSGAVEPTEPSYLICQGLLDLQNNKVNLNMRFYQEDGVSTVDNIFGNAKSDFDIRIFYLGVDPFNFDSTLGSQLEFSLDGYNIPVGTKQKTGVSEDMTITETLEWEDIVASFPPDNNTAR